MMIISYLIFIGVFAFRDASEDVVECARHEAGHGMRLAGARSPVRKHGAREALQGIADQRRAYLFVYLFLDK